MVNGMWRSLVAHFVRDEGAAGSNPVIPMLMCTVPNYLSSVTDSCRDATLGVVMTNSCR